MKTFAPDYYKDFKCIAGDCKHSCCIGWEIDIDEDTAEYYSGIPGEMGKRLEKNINREGECACFILGENERCPFLNEKGLCDIIINMGEDSLCQICSDHPRFRNFLEGRTEIGLGLCCEAAAKLVLEKKTPMTLVEIDDDGEEEELFEEEKKILGLREKYFGIFCDRNLSIEERIEKAIGKEKNEKLFGSFEKWAEVFLDLERLDDEWTRILENIKSSPERPKEYDEISAEQLLCYYTFRHFLNIEDEKTAALFIVLCFYMTEKAAEHTSLTEAARLYSSEIEYSDENIDALIEIIEAESEVF